MTDRTCSIDGCESTKLMARGWCGPHYKRWYRYGDPLATINRRAPDGATLEERLRYVGWTEVQVRPDMTACWEWDGLRDKAGYGRVWDGTRVEAAHRASYAVWNDPDIAGFFVQHRCDNPPCINPQHLTRGTVQTNTAEMVDRGRSANGERHGSAKLTDRIINEIRDRYTGQRGQQTQLAHEYGVVPSYISMLVRGVARAEATHEEGRNDAHRVGNSGPPI